MKFLKALTNDPNVMILQLSCWLFVFAVHYISNVVFIESEEDRYTLGHVFLATGIVLAFFYIAAFLFWGLAHAVRKNRALGVIIGVFTLLLPLLIIVFYNVLPALEFGFFGSGELPSKVRFLFITIRKFFHYGVEAGLLVALLINREVASAKQKAIEERLGFERRFLTAAIDPHLMNSMLNNISIELMALKNGAATKLSQVVQRYADLINYGLKHAKDALTTVPLKDELEQAERYLAAQCFRLAKDLPISIVATGCIADWCLPPTTLATLLGDVFKHGRYDDPRHPVFLWVDATPEELAIVCENKIGRTAWQHHSLGMGEGLLKRLLALVFPGQQPYQAGPKDGETYETRINIKRDTNGKV